MIYVNVYNNEDEEEDHYLGTLQLPKDIENYSKDGIISFEIDYEDDIPVAIILKKKE